MLNKFYIPFFITIGLFLIAIVYVGVIYTKWDNEPIDGSAEVEISLPVINWENYSRLSKQPE